MPVLGQQPPLPRKAAVRIVQPEDGENEQALVPAYPYYEEDPTLAIIENNHMIPPQMLAMPKMEASYQMDHKTLMFIAKGSANRPLQAPNHQFNPAVISCYDCGGDHYVKDCPPLEDSAGIVG